MATLSFRNINKIYDNKVQAVYDFSLEVADKEFIVFVGPSGCGKSTTLRMIAGLEDITSGELYIDDKLVNSVAPKNRNIAMVFQNYALYPHMTVYDNMAFSLRLRKTTLPTINKKLISAIQKKIASLQKNDESVSEELAMLNEKIKKFSDINYIKNMLANADDSYLNSINNEFNLELTKNDFLVYRHYSKQEIEEKVLKSAEILGLEPYLKRRPAALSGGQRQRVALGRAIVRSPKVFLMDEPLSNLDAKLRVQTRSEIIKIHKKVGATTIYVTHDQTEAMTMADRIVVMEDGYIQQIGTPKEVYDRPYNTFVAGFIGSPAMNFFNGTFDGKRFIFDGENSVSIELLESQISKMKNYIGKKVILGIRPESLFLSGNKEVEKPSNSFEIKCELSELLGYEYIAYGTIDNQSAVARIDVKNDINNNGVLQMVCELERISFFDPETTNNILVTND